MSTNPVIKKLLSLKVAAALTLFWSASLTPGADAPPLISNATNRFKITGMSCDGCARGIAAELKRTPGVVATEVCFSNRLATVAYDTNRISVAGLKKAIVDAGYGAKLVKSETATRR